MPRAVAKSELIAALRALNVGEYKTIGIVSDLAAFGDLESAGTQDGLGGYVECIREVSGNDVTIVVPTFTYIRKGEGSPYIHEETASETGALTEFIRKMSGSLRSVHPVFSFAAIGPAKEAICADASSHAYAWNSPAQRLIDADALVIALGLAPHRGTFLLHVAEIAAGVPYRYTKELAIPVYVGGEQIERPFFHFVKYRDADLAWDTNRVVGRLEARRKLLYAPIGASGIWAYRAKDMFDTTVGLLTRNAYALLAQAPGTRPWKR